MPRPCTICQHPKRREINKALVNQEAYRVIAKRFAASPAAVYRHRQHVPKTLVKAFEAKEAEHADDLLSRVLHLGTRAMAVLAEAEAEGDHRAALLAIREARGCLELQGKVTGELFERHAHIHAYAGERPSLDASALEPDEREALESIAQRVLARVMGKKEGFIPATRARKLSPDSQAPAPGEVVVCSPLEGSS